jgi:hypothetical protein
MFSVFCKSQTVDTVKQYKTESTTIKVTTNPLVEIQNKLDEFELYRQFNNIKSNIAIDVDPQTVWLRTAIVISKSEVADNNFSPHLLSPLERKYYEDSKFDAIKYVLGMAQIGAVGYLAYKHIKKYGFLK